MENTEAAKGTRGGWRAGAGRPKQEVVTERRDVRLPPDLIDLALRVGEGNFAEGVRRLMVEGARLVLHDMTEAPPLGTDILGLTDGRWRVVTASQEGDVVKLHDTGTGRRVQCDKWRLLPSI